MVGFGFFLLGRWKNVCDEFDDTVIEVEILLNSLFFKLTRIYK